MESSVSYIELTTMTDSPNSIPMSLPYSIVETQPYKIAKIFTNLRFYLQGWVRREVEFSSCIKPAFLLGKLYLSQGSPNLNFIKSFAEIPWLTYRTNFRPINFIDEKTLTITTITSDVGWGCTIRVGQMLLLTSLKRAVPQLSGLDLLRSVQEYRLEAPYSIHKITEAACKIERRSGEWLSPSDMSFVIEVRWT